GKLSRSGANDIPDKFIRLPDFATEALSKKAPGTTMSPASYQDLAGAFLKREIKSGSRHPEVVVRAGNDIPTEVVQQTKMRGKPNFKPAANLPECFPLAVIEFS